MSAPTAKAKPKLASAGGGATSPADEPVLHVYDGIEELDNQLPRWWVWTFLGSVIFATGYWLYYHGFDQGQLPSEEYAAQQAVELAAEAERLKKSGEITPELLMTLAKDPGTIAQGKATYDTVCVSCHAEGGKGNIGPNLTDDAWLHGGDPVAVYKIVNEGFLAKQMPAWGKQLGEEKTRSVVAYVLTIKNTNVPGGKAPQGDKAP
jgi:cytochrome c oxidase cbb3-type subunit III